MVLHGHRNIQWFEGLLYFQEYIGETLMCLYIFYLVSINKFQSIFTIWIYTFHNKSKMLHMYVNLNQDDES